MDENEKQLWINLTDLCRFIPSNVCGSITVTLVDQFVSRL